MMIGASCQTAGIPGKAAAAMAATVDGKLPISVFKLAENKISRLRDGMRVDGADDPLRKNRHLMRAAGVRAGQFQAMTTFGKRPGGLKVGDCQSSGNGGENPVSRFPPYLKALA